MEPVNAGLGTVGKQKQGRTSVGWVVLGVVLGLVCTSVGTAIADGSLATSSFSASPMKIPYEGYLTLDGIPVEGTQPVTFRIHSGAECSDCEVWSEAQNVAFNHGRFSVQLGETTSLDDVILDAEQMFISIAVGDVPLAGRQALRPVPWAHVAARAAVLAVERLVPGLGSPDLRIGGDLNIHNGALKAIGKQLLGTANNQLVIGDPRSYPGDGWYDLIIEADSMSVNGSISTTGVMDADSSDLNNVSSFQAGKLALRASATQVTAPQDTGYVYPAQITEQWADCGTKPIRAVRFAPGGGNYLNLQVVCHR